MLYLTLSNFPKQWQMLFQKPATTMMEGIIDLHHDIMAFLVIILIFVSFMLLTIFIRYSQKKGISLAFMKFHKGHGITHDTVLETIWTVIPTIILLFIATPSFALVYALDEIVEPQLTVRVAGRQWYWTYEFPDSVVVRRPFFPTEEPDLQLFQYPIYKTVLENLFEMEALKRPLFVAEELQELPRFLNKYKDFVTLDILNQFDLSEKETFVFSENVSRFPVQIVLEYPGFSFDSYLVPTEDLLPGAFRLLEVDRRLVLPAQTNIRLLITAYDVLHSWAVPAFGVKVDAVPGRLNEYFLNVNYNGLFYGQCSEICGVNHAFMPIKVEITSLELFSEWFAMNSVLEAPSFKFLNFLQPETTNQDVHVFWEIYQFGIANKKDLKNIFIDYYFVGDTKKRIEKMSQLVDVNYDLQDELIELLITTKVFTSSDLSQILDFFISENEVTFLLLEKVCVILGMPVDYFIHQDQIFLIFTPEICALLLNSLENLPESQAVDLAIDLFDLFDVIDSVENHLLFKQKK